MHRLICRGTATEYRAAERGDRFELTASCVTSAIEQHDPDVVFLCTPNNPTGTVLGAEVISAAYEATRGVVIVDEAYGEFCGPTRCGWAACRSGTSHRRQDPQQGPRVGRSAIGLRSGGASRGRCAPAGEVAVPLVGHDPSRRAGSPRAHRRAFCGWVEQLKAQRDRMAVELDHLGFDVYPSEGNFVFFGGISDQAELWQQLVAASVLVRDVGIPGHLRVTAGTPDETDAFLSAIRAITKESRP